MFEASQAELEAKQAEDRAIFKKRLAQMEAEKIKQQAELEGEQEVERARLKAKGLQALAEAAVEAEQLSFRVADDVISEPNIAAKNVSYGPECHDKVDRWLSEDHTSHPIEDNQEPIDAWIDRLIVGNETQITVSHTRSMDAVTHAIIRLESERDLPHISLPTFDGSALEWPRFVEQFYSHVHTRPGISDTRRMELLQSHLKGEAHSLVRGLGYSGRNYAQSLQELKRAFGHRIQVARAYLDRLCTGSVISSRDSVALQQFYINVRDCVTTLKQLHYTSYLYGSETLLRASRRLPIDKVNRWNEHIHKILRSREPNLLDLQKWLQEIVDAENNPYAVSLSRSSHYRRTMNTGMKRDQDNRTKYLAKGCPLCQDQHYIFRCSLFQNVDVTKRRELAQQNKLCFNCLKPGHQVSKCLSKGQCREESCGRSHHTLLHLPVESKDHDTAPLNNTSSSTFVESPENPVITAVNATSAQTTGHGKVFFQILPVIVKGNNGQSIHTHAVLDTASEITLIDTGLARHLGLKGNKRQLTIQTVNSEKTQASKVVSFNIKSTDEINDKGIAIKNAWTVDSSAFQCPSQHISSEWKHVQDLNMHNIDSSKVQILIGANVPLAHVQTDFRMGEDDQPVAIRTALGWSLMGTSDISSEEHYAKVNLLLSNDAVLEDQVQRLGSIESSGACSKYNATTSIEDHRSERILCEKTCFIEGHYEVGRHWRYQEINLPNNYSVAQRRCHSLEKRRHSNEGLKTMY